MNSGCEELAFLGCQNDYSLGVGGVDEFVAEFFKEV